MYEISKFLKVEIVHVSPVAIGSDLFRIIFDLRAIKPLSEAGKLLKQYEVWVTRKAVEDTLRLKEGATDKNIENFAYDFLNKRFIESGKIVPKENGAFISNTSRVQLGNPNAFPYKLENPQKKVKTTIMLQEDTLKWLKNYGHERNIGMGETIRRVIGDFQEGTVNYQQQPNQQITDTGGAATIKTDNQ